MTDETSTPSSTPVEAEPSSTTPAVDPSIRAIVERMAHDGEVVLDFSEQAASGALPDDFVRAVRAERKAAAEARRVARLPYAERRLLRPVSIRVEDLHVEYEMLGDRRDALQRMFVKRQGTGRTSVHALKGLSFDLREGDAVGIIGSNGSGKSTLLSALAGLLPPTSGDILTTAEPKLLGVGAALLPAASGLRNIRIGLLALGLDPDEAEDRVADVAEFTELGEALERPLRTYSSGMRARLLFGISTTIRPRILLIDEALAVGDKGFRDKSRKRIEEVLAGSGTLVLVSHNMREIKSVCNWGIWLEKGEMRFEGPIDEVLDQYGDTE